MTTKLPMSDAAVRAKTGKDWAGWFAVLDRVGAHKMPHAAIAAHLYDGLGVPEWWCQMIAVGYERARHLRAEHQTADGYAASVSKVVEAPVARLYRRFVALAAGAGLGEPVAISTKTPNKTVRLAFVRDGSRVAVSFQDKGVDKAQIVVQHRKLRSGRQVTERKAYWRKIIAALDATPT